MSISVETLALARKYTDTKAPTEQWVKDAADEWLEENVDPATGYVLDRSLTLNNAAAPADLVGDLKSALNDVDNLLDISKSESTIFKSLAQNPASRASLSISPFILSQLDYNNAPYSITSIKINIDTIGSLSVGKVLKTDAVQGGTYDATKFIVSQVLQIAETGEQTITINPVVISDEYYFFVGMPTDTAVFLYGGYGGTGLTLGFLYPYQTTFTYGANYLGIDLISTSKNVPNNIREAVNSIYSGKTLSILGDSISTFAGYIPEGNDAYYPSGTVTNVTDTWWKKLADALGMSINVNNSWSRSRVTTTNGDASAGCMTRCQNLGTAPDVIIVWMGINDFNNWVPLGTYDGKSAIPETTTTFREAYGIMLNKILTAYKTSEVWVCTLPQCERTGTGTQEFPEINGNNVALADFNVAIRELADSFGVKVLEHNKCGLTYQNMPVFNPDELHPNKFGHSLIANNDIWQMDNAIALRYPTA